jgi:hypothetical protein
VLDGYIQYGYQITLVHSSVCILSTVHHRLRSVQMHADIGKRRYLQHIHLYVQPMLCTLLHVHQYVLRLMHCERKRTSTVIGPRRRHDPWSHLAAIPHPLILHNQHEHNCKPFPSIPALGSNPRAWINPSLMKAGTNICTEFSQSMYSQWLKEIKLFCSILFYSWQWATSALFFKGTAAGDS